MPMLNKDAHPFPEDNEIYDHVEALHHLNVSEMMTEAAARKVHTALHDEYVQGVMDAHSDDVNNDGEVDVAGILLNALHNDPRVRVAEGFLKAVFKNERSQTD